MEELIKAIVTPLVDHPNDVRVTAKENDGLVTYSLTVHTEDKGKVIGRHGRIAKAIRSVVNAAATTRKERIQLEIF
ncbi:KH domain-containing protein [Pueribacillus sp. YX66]|uniref:KH domain-containing protein n=1 Tax=Pueribacillus sp. YX66 TaxID=3229242 RepID=UPI00358CE61E